MNCHRNLILLPIVFTQACALAPFSSNHSAHTVGKGNFSVQAGAWVPELVVPYVRIGYGITPDAELGVLSETQFAQVIAGFYGKYAFINAPEQGAVSVEVGIGGSGTSRYCYIGPSIGYKFNWWEPYLNARYNYVNIDFDNTVSRVWHFNEGTDLHYGLFTLGNTIWFCKNFGLNINVNAAFGDMQTVYAGAGLVFVF